jgi:hypothetical protein
MVGGESEVGDNFLGDIQSSGKGGGGNPRGWQRPVATGVERSPHGESGHQEQGLTCGPLTCGPSLVK